MVTQAQGLLCIGNPLIELHAEIPLGVLDRFGIPVNSTITAEERHMPLRELLETSYQVEYAPGGGAATTAMAVRTLCRISDGGRMTESADKDERSFPVALLGGVGRDVLAYKLRELLHEAEVQPLFSDSISQSTGWRAVLRADRAGVGGDRDGLGPAPGEDPDARSGHPGRSIACATFSGAAREYKLDHLRFKVWESVEAARVVYVDSLFLTVSAESAKSVAEYCAKMGNTFCLNLSAPFLCRYFYDRVLTLLPYTDFLMGSEAEFLALAEHRHEEWVGDIDAVASWLGRLPRADGDQGKRRHIVVTCGKEPAIVAATWRGYGVRVQRYPVPPVKPSRYVGKDGAGDIFAGGFLYGLLRGSDIDGCVQMALHAAQGAVQRIGPKLHLKDKPPA
jgi:adenosine kinase